MVTVPSPQEQKASCVPSSNLVASTPCPMGTLATTLPLVLSIITISLLPQPRNSRLCAGSKAMPEGSSPGASGHVLTTLCVLVLMTATSLLSSRLT